MINDPRFYLKITRRADNAIGWVWTDQTPLIWKYYVNPSVLVAEAYPLHRVEKVRAYLQALMGDAVRVEPVECKMPVELERLLSA